MDVTGLLLASFMGLVAYQLSKSSQLAYEKQLEFANQSLISTPTLVQFKTLDTQPRLYGCTYSRVITAPTNSAKVSAQKFF